MSSSEFSSWDPYRLIDALIYALQLLRKTPYIVLKRVVPDLADAALSIIPAAEFVERQEVEQLGPLFVDGQEWPTPSEEMRKAA